MPMVKHLAMLADLKKKGETSRSSAESIIELSNKMQGDLEKQLGQINEALASLKTEG